MSDRPDTPTLQKMSDVHERSQVVGEFLDWLLNSEHVHLMRWDSRVTHEKCTARWKERRSHEELQTAVDDLRELEAELAGVDPATLPERPLPPPPPHPTTCACGGSGVIETAIEDWVPWEPGGIQKMLGRFFGIDVEAAEQERSALLEWVREQNRADAR